MVPFHYLFFDVAFFYSYLVNFLTFFVSAFSTEEIVLLIERLCIGSAVKLVVDLHHAGQTGYVGNDWRVQRCRKPT